MSRKKRRAKKCRKARIKNAISPPINALNHLALSISSDLRKDLEKFSKEQQFEKERLEGPVCEKCGSQDWTYTNYGNHKCSECGTNQKSYRSNPFIIAGGMGADNDLTAWNDYYDTLLRMKQQLEVHFKTEGPYTIITNYDIQRGSQTGNNMVPPNSEQYNKNKEGYFTEYDYIMAKDWIKEWKLDQTLPNILLFTDGKNQIQTGVLTVF